MTTELDNFREIKGFFGCYFHEDWMDEAESPGQVIANYLKEKNENEDTKVLATQIHQFLDLYKDDKEMEDMAFRKLGCYYYPGDGNSMRDWLKHVADIFSKYK